ncbi:hypothetical protein RIF23_01820 [Lipingzhangella sp. LS1_29]|uniref:Major facilitator superfamily (MFS) profile domain-containing protein n=1 Tax=Lipingzhangella rawalii TaxID=2055835 RepID=A0ABU2H200_9ACTN|nr:hypothetical protein [Lipingzhangella rawalii]MDS1269027.1 hypothetical protein [Lipingzhangella rawalii]
MELLIVGIAIGAAVVIILLGAVVGFLLDLAEYALGCAVVLATVAIVAGCVATGAVVG